MANPIIHRFLTVGSVERAPGVRMGHKSRVLHPFKPVLQGFRGPLVVPIDTRGI